MTDSILIEELDAAQGKIGVLQLNSPKSLNSLSLEMVQTLAGQLKTWNDDDGIALIILKSSSDRAFCAGANIQELYHSAVANPGGPCELGEQFFLEEYALDYHIHQSTKPILGIGEGIVMGGGLGLMAGCSHRVATEHSRIAMPEITIGLFPDVGGTKFLGNMPYNLGYFFALTGAPLNANDAIYTQLMDACIASENLEKLHATLLATEWLSDAEQVHEQLDEIISSLSLSSRELDQAVPSNIKSQLDDLEMICHETSLAEIITAINTLETEDEWFVSARATLAAGSPLSSVLIYEQIKRFKHHDLRAVFLSEYVLATNIIRYPEFAEGVRALLIDKDKTPVWKFDHYSGVSSSLIDTMFRSPWEKNPLEELI